MNLRFRAKGSELRVKGFTVYQGGFLISFLPRAAAHSSLRRSNKHFRSVCGGLQLEFQSFKQKRFEQRIGVAEALAGLHARILPNTLRSAETVLDARGLVSCASERPLDKL